MGGPFSMKLWVLLVGGFVREFTQRVYLARGKLDRMSVDESAKKTTSDDSVEMCVEDQF